MTQFSSTSSNSYVEECFRLLHRNLDVSHMHLVRWKVSVKKNKGITARITQQQQVWTCAGQGCDLEDVLDKDSINNR